MKKETVTHVLFDWDLCQVISFTHYLVITIFIKNVTNSCGSTELTWPAHYVAQLFLLILRNFMKVLLIFSKQCSDNKKQLTKATQKRSITLALCIVRVKDFLKALCTRRSGK